MKIINMYIFTIWLIISICGQKNALIKKFNGIIQLSDSSKSSWKAQSGTELHHAVILSISCKSVPKNHVNCNKISALGL